jgi:hypothetical protein
MVRFVRAAYEALPPDEVLTNQARALEIMARRAQAFLRETEQRAQATSEARRARRQLLHDLGVVMGKEESHG